MPCYAFIGCRQRKVKHIHHKIKNGNRFIIDPITSSRYITMRKSIQNHKKKSRAQGKTREPQGTNNPRRPFSLAHAGAAATAAA